jgi:hypothetical protein
MKKIQRLFLFGIVAMSSPSPAGLRFDDPVVVNLTSGEAYGSIGTARNSADNVQYIGCSIEAGSNTDPIAACFAADATGTSILCTSSSPRIVGVVQAITSLSFIDFQWDSNFNCTFLYLINSSVSPPRAP